MDFFVFIEKVLHSFLHSGSRTVVQWDNLTDIEFLLHSLANTISQKLGSKPYISYNILYRKHIYVNPFYKKKNLNQLCLREVFFRSSHQIRIVFLLSWFMMKCEIINFLYSINLKLYIMNSRSKCDWNKNGSY